MIAVIAMVNDNEEQQEEEEEEGEGDELELEIPTGAPAASVPPALPVRQEYNDLPFMTSCFLLSTAVIVIVLTLLILFLFPVLLLLGCFGYCLYCISPATFTVNPSLWLGGANRESQLYLWNTTALDFNTIHEQEREPKISRSELESMLNVYFIVVDTPNDDSQQQQQQQLLALECLDTHSCDICILDYAVGDEVTKSRNTECDHIFHKECILDWMQKKPTCPCCRRYYLGTPATDTTVENNYNRSPWNRSRTFETMNAVTTEQMRIMHLVAAMDTSSVSSASRRLDTTVRSVTPEAVPLAQNDSDNNVSSQHPVEESFVGSRLGTEGFRTNRTRLNLVEEVRAVELMEQTDRLDTIMSDIESSQLRGSVEPDEVTAIEQRQLPQDPTTVERVTQL